MLASLEFAPVGWNQLMTLSVRPSRLLGILLMCAVSAMAATKPHYVVTNDDVPANLPSSVTFYTIHPDGTLTKKAKVGTGGNGAAAGYFGTQRVTVLNNAQSECVYASNAESGDIVGISVATLQQVGLARGSSTDNGIANGIGLAMSAGYLYAGFTGSSTIGTFQMSAGCNLTYVSSIQTNGLESGTVDGMAVYGNLLVVTYGDGSIQSFNISGGVPVSNGDEQNSTGSSGANWPSQVDITQDGHFAIFGDVSTATVVEVSDISSGKLTPTVVYRLGRDNNSSNIWLSPDESLLYVANTQGGEIEAAFFDKTNGTLSKGCTSKVLRGYANKWAYLSTMATDKTSGTGNVVYVAEYGAPSWIGVVDVTVAAGKCTLVEAAKSPVSDATSPGLLSIGVYPPRPF
jgi:lactonase family protein with 7-bladed beta-propeller